MRFPLPHGWYELKDKISTPQQRQDQMDQWDEDFPPWRAFRSMFYAVLLSIPFYIWSLRSPTVSILFMVWLGVLALWAAHQMAAVVPEERGSRRIMVGLGMLFLVPAGVVMVGTILA